MLGLNEPQIWTLIGVFGTAMFGLIALVLTSLRGQFASMRAEITTEIRGIRTEVTSEVGTLRIEMLAGFAVLGSRIDSLDNRLDHLDRDVQLLMNREFGDNRA